MSKGLLLRWERTSGARLAHWRQWSLVVSVSGRSDVCFWRIMDGDVDQSGHDGSPGRAKAAAEVALLDRLTGHEKAVLAKGAAGLSTGGEDGSSVRQD